MKNLSIVFFFLMSFAFMSVNAQAQTTCQPKDCKTNPICKKICSKTAKADKKAEGTASLVKLNATNETKTEQKASCKPANCKASCTKKGTKAATTSVTAVKNQNVTAKKEPVAALKPKSN